jgi:hypothetical protein
MLFPGFFEKPAKIAPSKGKKGKKGKTKGHLSKKLAEFIEEFFG